MLDYKPITRSGRAILLAQGLDDSVASRLFGKGETRSATHSAPPSTYNRVMYQVPRGNLADPSVEPTDEELHALMVAVRNSVVSRRRKAKARFRRRMDRAIHGSKGKSPQLPDRHGLTP